MTRPYVYAEETINTASRLYDARRAVRSLAGEKYTELLSEYTRLIRLAMERESKPPIPAMLVLAKHTDEPFTHLWLMAAAVEVIEQDGAIQ